jgi:hypothetical protein
MLAGKLDADGCAGKSGGGPPHSTTLRARGAAVIRASVLECVQPSAFAARQSAATARRRLALWPDIHGQLYSRPGPDEMFYLPNGLRFERTSVLRCFCIALPRGA